MHPEKVSQMARDAQKDFHRLVAMSSDQINHRRENSVDSNQSDDDGYDINWQYFIFNNGYFQRVTMFIMIIRTK